MVGRGTYVGRARGVTRLVGGSLAAGAALLASSCCRGTAKFPSDVSGGATIHQDQYVERWRLNGEAVCKKIIQAAFGCYLLEVEYGAKYVNTKNAGPPYFSAMIHPLGPFIEHEERTHRAEYHSPLVHFALPVEHLRWYEVTATFTGDEFLPRVVITDQYGQRLGELGPAKSVEELEDCRARGAGSVRQFGPRNTVR